MNTFIAIGSGITAGILAGRMIGGGLVVECITTAAVSFFTTYVVSRVLS